MSAPPRRPSGSSKDAASSSSSSRDQKADKQYADDGGDPPPPYSRKDRMRLFPLYKQSRRVLLVLWLLESVALGLVGAVCFGGAAAAVVHLGDLSIGALRSCTATTCNPWLAATGSGYSASSSSSSSASSSSSSSSTSTGERSLFLARADSSSSSSSSSTTSSSPITLPSFYLTTGLAVLSAFHLILTLWLFTLLRFFTAPPQPLPSQLAPDARDTAPRQEWWDGVKRFGWRVSGAFLVVGTGMVFVVACQCAWVGWQVDGAKGVGPGTIFLHMTWPILLYCTLVELNSRGGRAHRWLLKCGFMPCCGGNASARKSGDPGEDLEEGKPGKERDGKEAAPPPFAHRSRKRPAPGRRPDRRTDGARRR